MRTKLGVAQLGVVAAVAAVGVVVDLASDDGTAAIALPVTVMVGVGAGSPLSRSSRRWHVSTGTRRSRCQASRQSPSKRGSWVRLGPTANSCRGSRSPAGMGFGEGRSGPPALRGVYPVQLRSGRGGQVWQSPRWLFRVYARGTRSRPSFTTPEGVGRWWARSVTGGVLRASKRWPRPALRPAGPSACTSWSSSPTALRAPPRSGTGSAYS